MKAIPFDTPINRRHTGSSKWDDIPYDIQAEDMIPMWVADMDFACPPAVIEAVKKRLEHPVFGYLSLPPDYFHNIIHWHETRYHAALGETDIIPVSSVLGGVAMAVQALTKRGDSILVPTPGYHAFYNSVISNERNLVASPMINNMGHYELDFAGMEELILSEHVKLVLFCSPHNPTGRLWTRDELSALVELCRRHSVFLVSDEIHGDMTLGKPFTTVFSSNPRAQEIAVALYAPTKTFNIAGLCTAYAVIKDENLAKRFQRAILASGLKVKNTLGISALTGAYENGGEWVDRLQEYLLENARFAVSFINQNIPKVQTYLPEATYFLWIDFKETHMSPEEIIDTCVFKAHVAVTRGTDFILGGETFIRLNYACPRSLLEESLTRLKKAILK